ncbi:branched-chain amino acid ABC transporter permease [Yinghuangia soli]|uniref:Branched-chain amino acid ABC transporter permease n=1 Tax=Yinghuangia soli TaxID=2908204 RepID=A0AA41Q2M0_9ACTN|nr:branched-chain amino acid ABC transporter permease [Yinghuangia soli]MCF2530438.1 branched-chain amino acid ABC transporter permease [Yinghuangia soli]
MSSVTTKTREPEASFSATSLAKLRHKPWYKSDAFRRLVMCVLLGVLFTIMTGEQAGDDVFYSLNDSLTNWPWLGTWVAVAVGIWALITFHSYLLGNPALSPVHKVIKDATAEVKKVTPVLGRREVKWPLIIALVVVLALLPTWVSGFWNQVMVNEIAVYVLLAIGLNVVVGWAGLLDLGFIAFFAIGAYSAAYWTGKLPVSPPVELTPFLVIPVAVLTCLVAGVLLGAPTLRLRGDYLAIVTLGFHEIIYLLATNADEFTNGPAGVQGVPHPTLDLGFWSYEWTTTDLEQYWWMIMVIAGILIFLFLRLEHSKVGRAWTAIREDEVAAAANGVNTVKYKLMAFAIGASTSGIAGVVMASKVQFVSPASFELMFSVLVLAYVIFGGMGSIWGVMLGTAFLAWLPQILKDYVDEQDRHMYLGAILVIMMIFRPQGLIPSRRRKRELNLAKEGLGDADAMTEPVGGRVS